MSEKLMAVPCWF